MNIVNWWWWPKRKVVNRGCINFGSSALTSGLSPINDCESLVSSSEDDVSDSPLRPFVF